MFSLLHEVHFWTQKDGVFIKDLDFGAYMYCEKKNSLQCLLFEGKKSYAEGRGITWSLSNKRPRKLRDSLKELEDLLYNIRILHISWRNPSSIQVVFSNGLITYLQVNTATGDVEDISHDKFMIGKLNNQYISDVSLSATHGLFAYTDNQVTLAYFTKPNLRFGNIKKWSNLEIKLQHIQLAGPTGRRLDKQLSLNSSGDLISIWWKSGNDEVYPWSPVVKEEDRSNVHIYSLNGNKLELLCFYRTEFEPISIQFSATQANIIYTLQQKISRKSDVSIEWSSAEVTCGQLESNYTISLLVPTHSCVLSLSPKEDKLFIACIDGSLLIADSYGNILNTVKAAFIPHIVSWHPDGCLVIVANERAQLQWFDSYLNCVKCQFISEDATPSTALDIGSYFKYQPTLISMYWNRNAQDSDFNSENDDLLLLRFERGPIVIIRLITGGSEHKFTADIVATQYLADNNYDKAVNLLYTLDWEHEGETTLSTLQIIVSHLLRQPLTPEREALLEKALGSFHNPIRPIPQSAESEFVDSVHDLSRRFFNHLLRYQIFEKAFRLAIDLDDYDLFMDIHNYCKKIGNTNMATAALERAEEIMYSSESDSTTCDCSDSSCSCCSDSTGSNINNIKQKQLFPPPLPLLCTPQPAPRNRIKYSHRTLIAPHLPIGNSQHAIQEISPNAVGIPVVANFSNSVVYHNVIKQTQVKSIPYSTSFITDLRESLPSTVSNDTRPLTIVKDVKPSSYITNQDADQGKSENGKIKVVHFGLV